MAQTDDVKDPGLKEKAADLVDHVEDLANTFYKLTILNVTQKTTNIAANVIMGMSIVVFGSCVVLFLGLALSWWLGDLVGSRAGGFLLTAGFFILVLLIIAAVKKKIVFPYIRNRIIRKIYEHQN